MRRPIRAALALLLTTTLLVTACTGDGDGEGDGQPGGAGSADWQPCPDTPAEVLAPLQVPPTVLEQFTADITYECATIEVPRDWADPDGDAFEVALLRARHAEQRDRIGSLVVNPGGPGGSGVDLAVYLSFGPMLGGVPTEVIQRFDLVGFDPRGVKRSSPVQCFSDADLDASFGADPDPATAQQFATFLEDSERIAENCQQEYGEDLSYYSTHQTARDLDAIRAATGDERLTYLGFSYGTLLGGVYAHLFPERVRAMVLDGAVNPAEDSLTASRDQAEGFERAVDNFTVWCTDHPQLCPLRPDARTAITQAIEDAREQPVTGPDGRAATAGWVFYALVAALYSPQTWPPLAAAIEQLDGGDPTGVFDLADSYAERSADGTYSNLFDANTAISCADDDSTYEVSEVRALQDQWREELPLFGASAATGLLACQVWPARSDPYPYGAADGAPPILVVGTTGDPATPYESTAELASLLEVGVVLTWDGEGHTAYPGSSCINEVVNDYLVELTVPKDGTVCE